MTDSADPDIPAPIGLVTPVSRRDERSRLRRMLWPATWPRRVLSILLILALLPHLYLLALRFLPVPFTATMVSRIAPYDVERDWVGLSGISPHVVTSVIAAEDARFCTHNGIDWDAVEDAMENNAKGGRRRGGSTITQQTAKNVFLWQGGGYARKAMEAYFAYAIDFLWGKRRVMEVYLNVAEWGDGLFGIEAAAQERFGKPASELTPREAALLAAVLPSPNKWRANPPGPYVSGRANTLQARAADVSASGAAACVLG